MRQAGAEYLQEEGRLRGAQPRVKAVISPFELDLGLAPGSGEFVHTVYGGEPGKLALEPGYWTAGSWTSPVMHTFSPYLDRGTPSWQDLAGYLVAQVFLRAALEAERVSEAAYGLLASGTEVDLAPYFQIKVEFGQAIRAWSVDSPEEADQYTAYAVDQAPEAGFESYGVDGEFPGALTDLRLEGGLTLPESEILDPGEVRVELSRDFRELKSATQVVVLDNREGQWLAGAENFLFLGLPWEEKELSLYHGWELPHGGVEWQLLARGTLARVGDMAHGWRQRHRVRLECQDWVTARLKRPLGAPSSSGERRPFVRGFYRARAELTGTTPAQVAEPVKSGSGSATLRVLGTYRGDFSQDYLVEAETTGEVGQATFRWSVNQGQSWKDSGLTTAGAEDPVELEEGLAVYWEAGPGTDLVAGDRWTFAAQPPVYQYQVYGGPFASITAVFLNGEETRDRVAAEEATGVIEVTGRSGLIEARVVKDATTHPVDILTDILGEMGVSQAIHQDSFDLAKSLTPGYAIGVWFEDLPGVQALRHIVQRCLYDLWVDFGEIKIRAYLGGD